MLSTFPNMLTRYRVKACYPHFLCKSSLLCLVSIADVSGRMHLVQLLRDFVLAIVHLLGAEFFKTNDLFKQ
jgi:hypothetical protein